MIANSSNTHQNSSIQTMDAMDDDSVRLVVLGEASMLSTAILKATQRSGTSLSRSTSSQSKLSTLVAEYEDEDDVEDLISDPLLKSLIRLKGKLRKDKLVVTDPNYLKPFCEVIKNKDVSGPITGLALQSILKFINYGLIYNDFAVQMIADSVTKARFIGTDTSSDEVVLMRILNVLKELIVRRYASLTNGAICEIMQSCFRIAFEPRLSELLRKSAEQSLIDMVQILFRRISEFSHETADDLCYLKMGSKINSSLNKRSKHNTNNTDFTNKQSIKFNKEDPTDKKHQYYGLASIHELLSYLTSLINPLPEGQNTEAMINVGLTLLTVSFETAVHGIGSKHGLISTVKTDLCWNLMQLLQSDRPLSSFASSLRLAFLIFTNLRMHLKYQFEALLIRLMDIITTGNAPFEYREIGAEYLVAFFRHLTHLPHEIYFNYDCDPFASNLLEDLLQLFSKNCFTTSVNTQTTSMSNVTHFQFSSMQMLSLDALLAILKSLQKAELCRDDILVVCPAAITVNVVQNKIFNDIKPTGETLIQTPVQTTTEIPSIDSSEESKPLITATNPTLNCDVPQEVDVGSIRGETNEPFDELSVPFEANDNFETISPTELSENLESELPKPEPITPKTYVSYKFPKLEKVSKNTDEIVNQKQRKVMFSTATEQFNTKPAKGIQFMKENHLISCDMDIVSFLRDNPKLDKRQIGEYLSNKKNLNILQTFVESFAFKDTRLDAALRLFLESFRLPGEAPLISMILEHFAHHWHESNGCPFVNEDAAFSLAYAIIMLNVDQHNTNVKRQTNPMTFEEFRSNLRQVNGGSDFDPEMLKEIYFAIKTNEIIMPAEQQGLIRDRYLWKCLLRNSETENGVFWYMKDNSSVDTNSMITSDDKHINDFYLKLSTLNGPIFAVLWGPTVAAMTFVFDKINPEQQSGLTRRLLNNGFNSCALLCATYGHLDNLVVNLSKFIISSSVISSAVMSCKSQLAAQCLFGITREYANEMRESWNNIIELILNWYNSKLLNDAFEIEDFALDSKKIRFRRKDFQKLKPETDSSSTFLSSFYSYFAGNQQQNDSNEYNENNQNVNELNANQNNTIPSTSSLANNYCQPLLLIIEESKFLHIDSLLALIKALISIQLNPDVFDDDIEVFKLEILLKIILMNRDRVSVFWPQVYKHLSHLIALCPRSEYLLERVVSTIFRLAIRFTPRPDSLNEQIFLLLCHLLLTFEPNMIQKKTTAIALHSFVSQCSCYITRSQDWAIIFNFLLCVGIGFQRRSTKKFNEVYGNTNVQSDNEDNSIDNSSVQSRGYTSDSELDVSKAIDPNLDNTFRFFADNNSTNAVNSVPTYRILDLEAYEKSTEVLTLIIREVLPNNVKNFQSFESDGHIYTVAQLAVDALQKFVEASIKIQMSPGKTGQLRRSVAHKYGDSRKHRLKSRADASNKSRLSRIANAILSSSESEDEDPLPSASHESPPKFSSVTETCALRLLDLMHYFHLNAALTVENTSSEFLWTALWCPLLQGIALFCCDSRRPVRTCALTFLQRALLLHDLRVLSASQWENCFNKVLFPLLSKLLEPINMCDPIGMDETRMRTTNLLCKVFLQHLTPLLTLSTFTALWLTILDFMDKYMKADMQTDLVKEAIPESLKNILLVMETAGCFHGTLAAITWDRIAIFLPNLYQDLLPPQINTPSEPIKESVDEKSVKKESETQKESVVVADPQVSQQTIPTVNQNISEINNQFRGPVQSIPTPVIGNSTFIDMEEGFKAPIIGAVPQPLTQPLSQSIAQPIPQQLHSYHPYPGTIEPIVSMSQTNTNIVQREQTFVANAQMSAYPWPAPSDNCHKNY